MHNEIQRATPEFHDFHERIRSAVTEVHIGVLRQTLIADAIISHRVPDADLSAVLGHYGQMAIDTQRARDVLNDIVNEAAVQGIEVDLTLLTNETKKIAEEKIQTDREVTGSFDTKYLDLTKAKFTT